MLAVGGFRLLLAAQRPGDLRGRLLGEVRILIGHWTLDQEGWEELYNLRRDPLEPWIPAGPSPAAPWPPSARVVLKLAQNETTMVTW